MANAATVSHSLLQPQNLRLKNVLSESRSPYVRAHMNNPVAWQTWGADAINLGKQHNKLLFVSIGYAACHWCHVMEHESFQNHEVAELLNKSFIPIKVDREERPDVDRQYMNYVQATSGRGGWPLNVFLTPDLEPVFGGTYFPGPDTAIASQAPHLSFLGILQKIGNIWETQHERCLLSAKQVTAQLREFAQEGTLGELKDLSREGNNTLDLELLEEAYEYFANKFDHAYGGFGGPPKFPTPANLSFLLSLNHYSGAVNEIMSEKDRFHAQNMVLQTLRSMARGGIRDHIGHGFARYSVTQDWSLPHFEKMLYDQGQLLSIYLDAFLVCGDAEMLGAVYDISTYLTTPPIAAADGGFYSSEDADSFKQKGDVKKSEGAFYVWTMNEFQKILGEEVANICAKFWNVKENGNVSSKHDAHNELSHQNVLAINSGPDTLAKESGLARSEIVKVLKEGKAKLLEYRNKERPRPDLDNKIIVSWNGLVIGALARTSSVLATVDFKKANECLDNANRAINFIKEKLLDSETNSLRRIYCFEPGDTSAFAEDYAFLIQGLIDLYEATFDDKFLKLADNLQITQNKLFWDDEHGGFFSTPVNQSDMILRLKDGMDSAEPSTNGVSASNLCRLGSLLNEEHYTRKSRRIVMDSFSAEITQYPFLFTTMMSTLVAARQGMRSIVICGTGSDVEEAVSKSRSRLKLNTTVARLGGTARDAWLTSRNGLLREMDKGKKKIQICENGICREQLDMKEMEIALTELT